MFDVVVLVVCCSVFGSRSRLLLLVVSCLLFVVWCSLFVFRCLWCVTCCLLSAVRGFLFSDCYSLFVV